MLEQVRLIEVDMRVAKTRSQQRSMAFDIASPAETRSTLLRIMRLNIAHLASTEMDVPSASRFPVVQADIAEEVQFSSFASYSRSNLRMGRVQYTTSSAWLRWWRRRLRLDASQLCIYINALRLEVFAGHCCGERS